MGQELIYTSVPRGLKPGSRGFCTVVSTAGMGANLVQRLESLSGYRHVFGPQDANARLNPVVFSHLLVVVSGRPYHVLSRVADAGLDYTQRTNKLAHHVVLDVAERVPGGPAWLLGQPGFLQTTFDGQPRVLPVGRKPPAGNETPGVCRHWAQIAGDAGWGGALAEATALGQKAYLVFRPGMEMLPLLAESLALLPPEKRWGITFSTYLTGLPPGVDCQLACVVQGSPEHARLRQTPNALVIDLCGPLGPPPESAYVQAARSGDVSLLAGSASQAVAEYPSSQAASAPAAAVVGSQSRGAPGGSPPPLAMSASSPGAQLSPALQRRTFRRKEASKWPTYALLTGVPLLIFASIAALWLASRGGTDLAGNGDKPAVTARQRNRPVDKPDGQSAKPADAPEEPPAEDDVKPPPDDPGAQPKEPVEAPPTEESVEPPAGDDVTTPPEPTAAPPTEGHTSEEPAKQPDPKVAVSEPEGTTDPRPTLSYPVEIVPEEAKADEDDWYTVGRPGLVREGEQIQLRLIGPDKLFLSETVLEPVTVKGEEDANARQWHLMAKSSELATFALQDQHLRFKWGERPAGMFEPRSLRNCLLLVTKNGSDHRIAAITLRRPVTVEKVPAIGFLDRKAVPLPVKISDLPESLYDQLRWEFVPGTVGGGNGLPEVTIAEPDRPEPVAEPSQPPSGNVFSVTIPGEEPIKVTTKDTRVVAGRTGLALSFVPQMESSESLNPPWAKATATPLEKGRIGTLRGQGEKQLKNTENELRNSYSIRDLEYPEPLLKHNLETLQAKQKRQQQLAKEKLTPEMTTLARDLARDIDYFQGLVQRLNLIIEVRSYLNRLERLEKGFDALGRVYVGYRIYLPMGEEGDEPLLLVEGVKDPLEAKPHGAGKEALVADPGEAATTPPAAGSNGKDDKPPAADSGTKNDQPDSPKLFEEGE